jgi:hypothetical protein
MARNNVLACTLSAVAAGLLAACAVGPGPSPRDLAARADGAAGTSGVAPVPDAGVDERGGAGTTASPGAADADPSERGGAGTTASPGGADADPQERGGAGTTASPDAADADLPRCSPVPKCDAAPVDPGPARAWRHKVPAGAANHRGRDLFLNPGAPQWVIAAFRYGVLDAALTDEEVDIYLLRACGATWEKLGTALTTATASHADVEGVVDEPGRLFFEIPTNKALASGRHRLRLVVAGDLTTTELDIEVVPPGTALFVSDVDGTLTTSEDAQFFSLLTGAPPAENPDAPQALSLLASKGYRPFYLTARPDWLGSQTRDWLASKGFPPGVVHTTMSATGASGAAATTFKSNELGLLSRKGLRPRFAFGNSSSDADAYHDADIEPLTNRIFYQYSDSAWNGRRIDDYGSLRSAWATLSPVCRD